MQNLSAAATTQFAVINNKKIAYRQFGQGFPIIFTNRFRGVLDTWDPLFLDLLATKNQIILFDYPGIGQSEGELPLDIIEVASYAPRLADFLSIEKFNVLGWSYGGLVAQTVMFQNPGRVQKIILIGTNPPGNNEVPFEPAFLERALKPVNNLEDEIVLFFEPESTASKLAAEASHDRIGQRLDRSLIPATKEILQRYFAASATFKEDKLNFREQYKSLQTPVLIISGDHDISFATENWFPLLRNAPSVQHIIFNAAGHGPQHQFPVESAKYIHSFLGE